MPIKKEESPNEWDSFEVGDVLRVKSWEQLADEYPVVWGDIQMPLCGFNKQMRYMCGREFTVKRIIREGDGFTYLRSEEGLENDDQRPAGHWFVTVLMVEKVDESEVPEVDPEALLSML